MKNKNIKNILFCITLIPYIILLVMSIYYAIVGYGSHLDSITYGFMAAARFFRDVYNYVVINVCLYPIPVCIIILWVGYQMYYFIGLKSNIRLKKILFFIAILCWVIYFALGIRAFFVGFNAGGGFGIEKEYGIEALVHTLFSYLILFSYIPVLPNSLLYIIIYVIVKCRKRE